MVRINKQMGGQVGAPADKLRAAMKAVWAENPELATAIRTKMQALWSTDPDFITLAGKLRTGARQAWSAQALAALVESMVQ